MKLDDLDLRELLQFEPTGGLIHFAGDRALILDTFALGILRATLIETVSAEVADVSAQGERAWAFVTTRERHLPTGREFTIETAHQFQFDADGRIKRWRAFFDPNPEVDVLRDALDAADAKPAPVA